MPPKNRSVQGGRAKIPDPEWVALEARIKTRYDIEKVAFSRDMTAREAGRVGARNRRVEHLVLTSPETSTHDALAFVWHRAKSTKDKVKYSAKKTED